MTEDQKLKERERYAKRRESILTQKRLSYPLKRAAKLAYNRAYYQNNRLKLIQSASCFRKNNKDIVNSSNAKYCRNNRAKVNAWTARYRDKNRAAFRAKDSERRALEVGADVSPKESKEFFSWVKNQDWVNCTYCGVFISGDKVEVDHIVPITRGGAHHPDNFCVSCRSCNASKGDRLLSEWRKCPEKFTMI